MPSREFALAKTNSLNKSNKWMWHQCHARRLSQIFNMLCDAYTFDASQNLQIKKNRWQQLSTKRNTCLCMSLARACVCLELSRRSYFCKSHTASVQSAQSGNWCRRSKCQTYRPHTIECIEFTKESEKPIRLYYLLQYRRNCSRAQHIYSYV